MPEAERIASGPRCCLADPVQRRILGPAKFVWIVISSRGGVLERRMRVKARCPYRNFKSHMPAAARSYRKRVVYQDRHLVGKFVVAAVHDFVDSCKHRFLTRVKLLHQQRGSLFANYVSEPAGLGGIVLFGNSIQQRRLLS